LAPASSIFREQRFEASAQVAPVPVVDAQRGVWNPKELSSTLSVVSMLQSKYADETDDDVSIIRHHYRDTHVNGDTAPSSLKTTPLCRFF